MMQKNCYLSDKIVLKPEIRNSNSQKHQNSNIQILIKKNWNLPDIIVLNPSLTAPQNSNQILIM